MPDWDLRGAADDLIRALPRFPLGGLLVSRPSDIGAEAGHELRFPAFPLLYSSFSGCSLCCSTEQPDLLSQVLKPIAGKIHS